MALYVCLDCCNEIDSARKPKACPGCGDPKTLVRIKEAR